MKLLLATNIITVVLLAFLFVREKYPQRIKKKFTEPYTYAQNWQYIQGIGFYKHYKKKGNVVMLGNSITYRCNWNELLDRNDVINRGIEFDVTEGFLNRMDFVFKAGPKICFIMGGVNDIILNMPKEETVKNMNKIMDTLLSGQITPIVQSILYVADDFHNQATINKKIKATNSLIEQSCKKKDVAFLNVNEILGNKGALKKEYSFDGIHLTGQAYEKWGDAINSIIEKQLNEVEMVQTSMLKN